MRKSNGRTEVSPDCGDCGDCAPRVSEFAISAISSSAFSNSSSSSSVKSMPVSSGLDMDGYTIVVETAAAAAACRRVRR